MKKVKFTLQLATETNKGSVTMWWNTIGATYVSILNGVRW